MLRRPIVMIMLSSFDTDHYSVTVGRTDGTAIALQYNVWQ